MIPIFRRAEAQDAEVVHEILAECGIAMQVRGFHNWIPPRPIESIVKDIATREVFVVYVEGNAAATVALGNTPTIPYADDVPWGSAARATYVNRLAVRPSLQGSGLGSHITQWVERHAEGKGSAAVRLDALSSNDALIAFYSRAGYAIRAYREHSGWRFAVMEKLLRT